MSGYTAGLLPLADNSQKECEWSLLKNTEKYVKIMMCVCFERYCLSYLFFTQVAIDDFLEKVSMVLSFINMLYKLNETFEE